MNSQCNDVWITMDRSIWIDQAWTLRKDLGH
jgi:hypothetical protein